MSWLRKGFLFIFNFFIFWLHCMACGILVPWPGINPVPPAVESWSPNHWTTREFLGKSFNCEDCSYFPSASLLSLKLKILSNSLSALHGLGTQVLPCPVILLWTCPNLPMFLLKHVAQKKRILQCVTTNRARAAGPLPSLMRKPHFYRSSNCALIRPHQKCVFTGLHLTMIWPKSVDVKSEKVMGG